MSFEEVRLPTQYKGSSGGGPAFRTTRVEVSSGAEQRISQWANSKRHWRLDYEMSLADVSGAGTTTLEGLSTLIAFFEGMAGAGVGFRFKDWNDYTATNSPIPPPQEDNAGSIQLYRLKTFGNVQRFKKIVKPTSTTIPVAGGVALTMKRAGSAYTPGTIDYTTGLIPLGTADISKSITALTKAASAVITVGAAHGFVVGELVHITGVVGMTEINGLIGRITATAATTITVNIASTAFTAYTSGGNASRYLKGRPITGITKANPGVLTLPSGHGFLANDVCYISGVAGMTQVNGKAVTLASVTATTATTDLNTSLYSAYTSGGYLDETLTWSGEYDIPATFDVDELPASAEDFFRAISGLPVVESFL